MSYDTWKTTDPRDAELDGDPPCRWRLDEHGWDYCETCGAKWEWQCTPEQKR